VWRWVGEDGSGEVGGVEAAVDNVVDDDDGWVGSESEG
jgi:hypothetical protein